MLVDGTDRRLGLLLGLLLGVGVGLGLGLGLGVGATCSSMAPTAGVTLPLKPIPNLHPCPYP